MNESKPWAPFSNWTKITPGKRTWALAAELAIKRAKITGQKQIVRGQRMPKGSWVYSTGWVS